MLMNCPSCGSENAAHRRYCRKCGRAMGASCPAVKSLSPPGQEDPPIESFFGESNGS